VDAASRGLLEGWISGVLQRPQSHCGVFVGDDGRAFGPRAHPWDSPDVLVTGEVVDDALVLELSDGAMLIDGVGGVEPGDHPWGAGLRVTGVVAGSPCEIWLV
jgi:hypothetical protein